MPVIGGRRTSSPLRMFARVGIVAVACYAAWLAVEAFGRPYDFFDMKIYHGAMAWWTQGGELYEYIAAVNHEVGVRRLHGHRGVVHGFE